MKTQLGASLAAMMIILTACGEVVTPKATTTSRVSSTLRPMPTPTGWATATAPVRPPADTATPTITPTPIIHVVQKGDTLQGIAFDYGVSVKSLQEVNGIDNPLALQIGQHLIIPVGEEEEEKAAGLLLPTPTPQPFRVQGTAFYETAVGGLQGMGEVVNTTSVTLTNVIVKVGLFNAAGEPLAEADTFAEADLIPPGARSPVGILFTTPPSGWANYQVTIIRGDKAGALASSYTPIEVTQVDGRPSGAQFRVSGVVRNASKERAAENIRVIATTYDGEGLVTGFRQHTVEVNGALAPGATASFDIAFTPHGDDVPKDFNVIALGRAPSR